jgi:uncharacterized sulfatase
MITGLYPHQHKITNNDPPAPPGLPARLFHESEAFRAGREVMRSHLTATATIPALAAPVGYQSLQTGKWWLGDYASGGFTHGMTRGNRHGDAGLAIGRETMAPIENFIDASTKEHRPFFVWYAPMMPHQPHNPPDRLLDDYRTKTKSEHVARYWAMIEWFDETVGQLLDMLETKGLSDNTIVIYLTDNGWIQDPDQARFAARSKQSPYDGGLRTPIIVRWPARVKPSRCDRPVSSIDIATTLLPAMGLKAPAGLPGVNLLDDEQVADRPAIFGACFTHNAVDLDRPASSLRWRWVIADPYKLIVPDSAREPAGRVELYQLLEDPVEDKNLADVLPDRTAALMKTLDAWWHP